MNPVNATSLYVSASRSVLQCDPRDPRALAELCKLLPFFRQSLSCLVCGNLLVDPIAPASSPCQHYVCRGCRGLRMRLRPPCSWCKDQSRFEENRQLSLLVHCYRKLCVYITQSPLAQHIASAAGDSPDLQAVLNEGLTLAEQTQDALNDSAMMSEPASTSSSELLSQQRAENKTPPPKDVVKKEEPNPLRLSVNGRLLSHDCNGLVGSEPPLHQHSITMDTGGGGVGGGGVVVVVAKQESFSEEVPVCVTASGGGDSGLCDITFSDDLKHGGGGGGPLLLSVEEVLRTLETDNSEPAPTHPSSVPQFSFNGPSRNPSRVNPEVTPRPCPLQTHPQQQPPPPSSTTTVAPPFLHTVPTRYHRKRSRSESDSEKVQPLPISSLLRVPLDRSPRHPHPGVTIKQETKFPLTHSHSPHPHPHPHHHHPHLAPVPNGGPPKMGKTVLVSNKALKKTVDHHGVGGGGGGGGGPKKAYTKPRQGTPKPRAQPRDRVPPHPHPHAHPHPLTHPPSPSKPLYKKPVEKKGCKCGRATQNPSVLTCRGQRCPCYSNRKACLDCICRGCQNSYMANGEKKLEAFAVPEKALEQTRLTLGINLTSITAATLRSPTTMTTTISPGNNNNNSNHNNNSNTLNLTTATGAPVTATFLSGVGGGHHHHNNNNHHDNNNRGNYDDSLEMRFDC